MNQLSNDPDTKPAHESKTIWVNAITVLIGIVAAFTPGSPVNDLLKDLAGPDNANVPEIVGAVMVIGGVVNTILRFATRKGVTLVK